MCKYSDFLNQAPGSIDVGVHGCFDLKWRLMDGHFIVNFACAENLKLKVLEAFTELFQLEDREYTEFYSRKGGFGRIRFKCTLVNRTYDLPDVESPSPAIEKKKGCFARFFEACFGDDGVGESKQNDIMLSHRLL